MSSDFVKPKPGDHAGWKVFFDRAYTLVLRAMTNRAGGWRFVSPVDLEDLAGTVATKFMQAMHRDAVEDEPRRYLLRMARNELISMVRKKKADKRQEDKKDLISDLESASEDLEADEWVDESYQEKMDPCVRSPFSRPDQAADDRSRLLALTAALREMPEKMRTLITSLRLGRKSQAEVAEMLGVNEKSVGGHLNNAVEHLRKKLVENPLFKGYFD